jgi:hypothetical protein
MASEYAESTVIPALRDGLVSVVKAQPGDPVDFLGNFLLCYAKSMEADLAVRRA